MLKSTHVHKTPKPLKNVITHFQFFHQLKKEIKLQISKNACCMPQKIPRIKLVDIRNQFLGFLHIILVFVTEFFDEHLFLEAYSMPHNQKVKDSDSGEG